MNSFDILFEIVPGSFSSQYLIASNWAQVVIYVGIHAGCIKCSQDYFLTNSVRYIIQKVDSITNVTGNIM